MFTNGLRIGTFLAFLVGTLSPAINLPDEIKGSRNSREFIRIEKSAARITLRGRHASGGTYDFAVSGTLVDRDTVATAGHAFSVGATELSVDINGYRFEANIANVQVPAGYRWGRGGCPEDIALIQLSRPVPESLIRSGRVLPMELLPASEKALAGKSIRFAGFGDLADEGYQSRSSQGRMQMKTYDVGTSDIFENPTLGLGICRGSKKDPVPGKSGLPSGGDSGGSVVYFIGNTPYLVGVLRGPSIPQQCFTWSSVRPYLSPGDEVSFSVPAKTPSISADALEEPSGPRR